MWEVRLKKATWCWRGRKGNCFSRQRAADPVDPAATMILYDLEVDRGCFWATREDLQVREAELLVRRGITVVNVLDIESYLLAVVPSRCTRPCRSGFEGAGHRRPHLRPAPWAAASRGFDVLGPSPPPRPGVAERPPRPGGAGDARPGAHLPGPAGQRRPPPAPAGTPPRAEAGAAGNRSRKAVPNGDCRRRARISLAPRRWSAAERDPGRLLIVPGGRAEHSAGCGWWRRTRSRRLGRPVGRSTPSSRPAWPGVRRSVTVVGSQAGTRCGRCHPQRDWGLKSNASGGAGAGRTAHCVSFFGAGFGYGVGMSQLGAAGMGRRDGGRGDPGALPGTEIRPGYTAEPRRSRRSARRWPRRSGWKRHPARDASWAASGGTFWNRRVLRPGRRWRQSAWV